MNPQNYRQVHGNNGPRGVIHSAKQAAVKETYPSVPNRAMCTHLLCTLKFLAWLFAFQLTVNLPFSHSGKEKKKREKKKWVYNPSALGVEILQQSLL